MGDEREPTLALERGGGGGWTVGRRERLVAVRSGGGDDRLVALGRQVAAQ